MPSSCSSDHNFRRRTRLQSRNEKQLEDEQLKEKAMMKRRKKMFQPRKVIGPRDIVVNSKIPKIKLEEDVTSRSIKQEYLEAKPILTEELRELVQLNDNREDDEMGLEQKVILQEKDKNTEENKSLMAPLSVKLENDQSLQNHIQLLKVLVDQKDQEVNTLTELIKGLSSSSNNLDSASVNGQLEPEIDDDTINTGGVLDMKQIMTKLNCDLKTKDTKIKLLTTHMFNLQSRLLQKANNSLALRQGYQLSEEIVLESFDKILPLLYPQFHLNDLLTCRAICHRWNSAVDTFLDNKSSLIPFDKYTHLKYFQNIEVGCNAKWRKSPLDKLAKIYTFSDTRALKNFTDNRKGIIIGSTVELGNIILNNQADDFHVKELTKFLENFGSKIRHIKIRQIIESPSFSIELLMDRIKLCLRNLPNLKYLSILFCVDAKEIQKQNSWGKLEANGKVIPKNWQTSNFPKLESLESLLINVEVLEGWTMHANFLRNFSKCLIKPYQKQLKQLSVFAHEIGYSECLVVPNLVDLTIPQRYLGQKAEFGCEKVEKLNLTSCVYVLTHDIILVVKRLFPKLVSLAFKFEYRGGKFENLYWTQFTPKLQDLLILELENCGVVTFNVLRCFPNVRYLKFIINCLDKVEDLGKENVLNIMNLWNGENLYESKLFWDNFPHICVVEVVFSGDSSSISKPEKRNWTRKCYNEYWETLNLTISC